MRCMRSSITGLEQVWGKRKPGSAVNSQESNRRAFQSCYSEPLPALPCPAGDAQRRLPLQLLAFLHARRFDWNFIQVCIAQLLEV